MPDISFDSWAKLHLDYKKLTEIEKAITDLKAGTDKPNPLYVQMSVSRLNERYTPIVISIRNEIKKYTDIYDDISAKQILELTHQYQYLLAKFDDILDTLKQKWHKLRPVDKVRC
jgi:hypothetical protein